MAKFCGKCGSALDPQTSLCPNCDLPKVEADSLEQVQQYVDAEPAQENIQENVQPNIQENIQENVQPSIQEEVKVTTNIEKYEKPKKKSKNGVKIFLTVLLSILLSIVMVASLVVVSIRTATLSSGLNKLTEDMQLSAVLNENIYYIYGDKTLPFNEFLADYISDVTLSDVDSYKVNNFIDKSTFKPYVINKVWAMCRTAYDGQLTFEVSKKEIAQLIRDNSAVMMSELGVILSEERIDELAGALMTVSDSDVIYSANIIRSNSLEDYCIHIGMSYITMAVLLFCVLLLIVLMLIKNLSKGFLGIGCTFTVVGVIFTVITLIVKLFGSDILPQAAVAQLIGDFLFNNILMYAAVLVVGIVVLVVRAIIVNFKKKKAVVAD